MAETEIKAGARIETVTPAELQAEFDRRMRQLAKFAEPVRKNAAGDTDASSGDLTLDLYTVPPGRRFRLLSYYVRVAGYSAGSPSKAAAGELNMLCNGDPFWGRGVAFGDANGLELPMEGDFSLSQSPLFFSAEVISFQFLGAPKAATIVVRFQGELEELPLPL